MRTALVITIAEPMTAAEIDRLRTARESSPELSLFLVTLNGVPLAGEKLFDRVFSLPLTQEHRIVGDCLGVQLALNEGYNLVGVLSSISSIDIALSRRIFTELERASADFVVVKHGVHAEDTFYISQRAAFACSFWLALTRDITEHRFSVVSELCRLTNRKIGLITEKVFGAIRLHTPNREQQAVLGINTSTLAKLIGIRVGEFVPAISDPVKKIAVITPYYKESGAELTRCLESVQSQTYPCSHFMISDGFPSSVVEQSDATHIKLNLAHADNGNTPRYVGSIIALALGYDAIAYLDADNWFEPDHVETLVSTQQRTNANAVFSYRNIHLPDGYMLPDADPEDLSKLHVDTSCYLLTRDCEYVAHLFGQMPQTWGPVCDRVVYRALEGTRVGWTEKRTLNFKSNYAAHFRKAGRPLPEKVNDIPIELWRRMTRMDKVTAELAISRMGRPISISNPYRRAKNGRR